MKTIKKANLEMWEKDPISAKKNRLNGLGVSCCNCDCNWDGDGAPLSCTGSISN